MVQTENQSKNGITIKMTKIAKDSKNSKNGITIKHHKSEDVYAWNPSIGAWKCNKDFEID